MLPQDRSIHFRSDGLALSPAEYARLLAPDRRRRGDRCRRVFAGRCGRTARTAHGRNSSARRLRYLCRRARLANHLALRLLSQARASGAGPARKPHLLRLRRLRPGVERTGPWSRSRGTDELYSGQRDDRGRGAKIEGRHRTMVSDFDQIRRRQGFRPCRDAAHHRLCPRAWDRLHLDGARLFLAAALYRYRTFDLRRAVRYRLRVAVQIFQRGRRGDLGRLAAAARRALSSAPHVRQRAAPGLALRSGRIALPRRVRRTLRRSGGNGGSAVWARWASARVEVLRSGGFDQRHPPAAARRRRGGADRDGSPRVGYRCRRRSPPLPMPPSSS